MNTKFSNYSLSLFFISLFLTEIGFHFANTRLISISSNLASVILICMFLSMFKNITQRTLLNSFITITLIGSVYAIKFYTQPTVDVRDMLFILITTLAIIVSSQLTIDISKHHFLKFGFYFISIFMLYASTKSDSFSIYFDNALMLGYSNPNVTSSVLLTHIIYITLLTSDKIKYKLLDITIIIVNLYLISLTQSRTALISGSLILIYMFVGKLIPKKALQFSSYISVLLPALFILFDDTINKLTSKLNYFVNSVKPKDLNGRSNIWSYHLESLYSNSNYFFLGVPVTEMKLVTNSHNYLLFIFYHHGLLILCNYIYLLFSTIKRKCKNLNRLNLISIFCWIIVMISNSFESHLATGLISFSISWILLLSNIIESKSLNQSEN